MSKKTIAICHIFYIICQNVVIFFKLRATKDKKWQLLLKMQKVYLKDLNQRWRFGQKSYFKEFSLTLFSFSRCADFVL